MMVVVKFYNLLNCGSSVRVNEQRRLLPVCESGCIVTGGSISFVRSEAERSLARRQASLKALPTPSLSSTVGSPSVGFGFDDVPR